MPVTIVVGAQWGDEGKAKVIDLLAEEANVVIRYQGGCNAGHTVVRDGETFKFHLVPSGILYGNKKCLIGPGVVISPEVFSQELEGLRDRGIALDRLHISSRAHVTLPHHRALDEAKENSLGDGKIGTTKRGIGPTYEDKVGRIGLRVADLLLPDASLLKRLEVIAQQRNPILEKAYGLPPLNARELMVICQEYRVILGKFVADTDEIIAQALSRGERILLEGAQGTMLDLDHGTYPYVTSSNPTAGGACVGSGIGPLNISRVIGVAKAYTTRVGEGPFPTELFDDAGQHLAKVGNEFGTTTGRPRRCGWFDAVAMRYAAQINGLDGMAITKLDVFEGLEELSICTAYRNKNTGEVVNRFPDHIEFLAEMEPVFETFPGWKESIRGVRKYDDLPQAARNYLSRLAEVVGVPISIVSVGPQRDETIVTEKALFAPSERALASLG